MRRARRRNLSVCSRLIAIGLVASGTIAGCAVTTYGFAPKELEPGKYSFKLSYNSDATDELIDAKASQIVEKIRSDGEFSACSYTRSEMVSPWRVKEIDVIVNCES